MKSILQVINPFILVMRPVGPELSLAVVRLRSESVALPRQRFLVLDGRAQFQIA
jgi:hypothetical protein